MAADNIAQAADDVCEKICEDYGEAGLDTMYGMCGNDGQTSIIDNAADDYLACAQDCENGDAPEFGTDHDDAVGEIVAVGQAYLDAAADLCALIRLAEEDNNIDDIEGFDD